MSGPLDRGLFSGPLEKGSSDQFQRSFSHGGFAFRSRSGKRSLIRVLQRAISKKITRGQNSIVAPIKGGVGVGVVKEPEWILSSEKQNELTVSSLNLSSDGSLEDDDSLESQNLQWAQGKAGEDRVHVVVSEEHGWVFVGIYDGFNGPDAPDYLLSNLYSAVHKELKGLLWDDKFDSDKISAPASSPVQTDTSNSVESANSRLENVLHNSETNGNCGNDQCYRYLDRDNHPSASWEVGFDMNLKRKKSRSSKGKYRGAAKKWEENQRRWKCEWDRERMELDKRLKEQLNRSGSDTSPINHADVLEALSQALKKTEESYLDIADKMLVENPELALMGSCVLVMLMKGEDVYVMNVGDSRAVLAQKAEPDYWLGKIRQDLERINEETLHDLEASDGERSNSMPSLSASQLSVDHSTSVEEV
jgi:serine/threonine protein phosphatase PrpC